MTFRPVSGLVVELQDLCSTEGSVLCFTLCLYTWNGQGNVTVWERLFVGAFWYHTQASECIGC
jgi:hypothetical protein